MVELRDATVADAPAIAAVHVASWQVGYRGLLPDDLLDGLSVATRARTWADRLAAPGSRRRTLLVVDDVTVLGFASTGPTPDGGPADGELYALYLDPRAWGAGHGRLVHDGALGNLRADGFTRAGLWFLDGNERALRFYRRQGWTETGETKIDRDVAGGVPVCEHRLTRTLGRGGPA